jgi:hypothetical protein
MNAATGALFMGSLAIVSCVAVSFSRGFENGKRADSLREQLFDTYAKRIFPTWAIGYLAGFYLIPFLNEKRPRRRSGE